MNLFLHDVIVMLRRIRCSRLMFRIPWEATRPREIPGVKTRRVRESDSRLRDDSRRSIRPSREFICIREVSTVARYRRLSVECEMIRVTRGQYLVMKIVGHTSRLPNEDRCARQSTCAFKWMQTDSRVSLICKRVKPDYVDGEV